MKKRIFGLLLALVVLFGLFACGKNNKGDAEALEKAKNFVYNLYKDGSETTADDYQLVSHVAVDGVQYDVEWTVEVKSGDANDVKVVAVAGEKTTIDVNKFASVEVSYTLKATIKDEQKELHLVMD